MVPQLARYVDLTPDSNANYHSSVQGVVGRHPVLFALTHPQQDHDVKVKVLRQ